VFRALEQRSDATNEDVVVLVNHYLKQAFASEASNAIIADPEHE
jgi:hypothetical protein